MLRLLSALAAALALLACAGAASAATLTYGFSGTYSLPATGTFSGTFVYDDVTDTVTSGSATVSAGLGSDGIAVRPAATWTLVGYDSALGRIGFATSTPATGQPGFILVLTDLPTGAPVFVRVFEGNCGDAGCSQGSYPGGNGRSEFGGLLGRVPTVTAVSPAAGPTQGGAVVTITGTEFTGVTAVTFGGLPATIFTVDSTTQLTATAPAGAVGPVDVQVTTPGGTTANTSADDFTYFTPATVPTMTEWAMVLFGIILAGGTAIYIQQRKLAA